MSITKSRHAPPKAAAIVESLRGLGYTAGSALADIVDNSITASADEVDIVFSWDGEQHRVSVADNGIGMTDGELEAAMRLGRISPLTERSAADLGRFGMGLKTASFSQCRRLTVASRKNGITSCLRWDLDVLAASRDDGWHLLEGPAQGSERQFHPIDSLPHGTLVLWELLDRIVTPGFQQQDLLNLIDLVEAHLGMVFHSFISGSRPRLRLTVNGRPVVPWDPFMTTNAATWSSPIDRITTAAGIIEVQGYVLPHKDRLDQRDYDCAAGPEGWTAQQGFYIYRNERLLVAGSWLGLGQGRSWTKEEAHRLARIRLDLPNTADFDWKIDIRKSSARPPVSIRERLSRLAEDTRERARRVFVRRGHGGTGPAEPLATVWRVDHLRGGIRYRVDESHVAVKTLLDDAGPLGPRIRAMIGVIEATIPVQRIWLDTADAHDAARASFSGPASPEVEGLLSILYRNLVLLKGVSPALAKQQLLGTEPFYDYPNLVMALPDELGAEIQE